jgi:serine protease Do
MFLKISKMRYAALISVLLTVLILCGCTFTVYTTSIPANPPASTPAITRSAVTTVLSTPPIPVDTNTVVLIPDFVSVIAKVRPSVVAITTTVPGISIFGGQYSQEGAGSGWIIDKDGIIVTNNHVIEGASDVTVTLDDGRTFPAQSVKGDSVADLAVIKIDAHDLPTLQISDSSKMLVGQWVVAIGNSLGLGISATKGMVSALGVTLSLSPGESLDDLIQTDAAINPGNSGGPLVNLYGQIVGINSAKISQIGVEGMGYAISINSAKPMIDELIKNGFVVRPYLGTGLYTVDQFAILRYRLRVDSGAMVTTVASGSPAEKAGIVPGDVITGIDGAVINGAEDVNGILQSHKVGDTIQITFYTGRTKKTASVTLTQSSGI